MKKFNLISLLLLAWVALTQGGCSEENVEETPSGGEADAAVVEFADGTELYPVVTAGGGTVQVTFNASESWTAEVDAVTRAVDWVSVSPASGAAGEHTVTVTVQPNEGYDERNAALTVRSGKTQQTLTLTQKQQDALIVTSAKVELDAAGGEFGIELRANGSVTYEIAADAQSWLKSAPEVEGTRALQASVIRLLADANEDKESRQGSVTLRMGDLAEEVIVYQSGSEPSLVISQKDYVVGSAGETVTVELKSNTRYTVQMPGVNWISEASEPTRSAYTHRFTIFPNSTSEARRATVTFIDAENGLTQEVGIYQVAVDDIAVAKDVYILPYEESTLDFALQTDAEVEVEINSNWFAQVDSRNGQSAVLCFHITANDLPDSDREGTITLREKSGGGIQTIRLVQSRQGRNLVSVTYQAIMAWGMRGYVQDESGNIFYNPSLSDPADWYEADYTPVVHRVRTYSDGYRVAEVWNDYSTIASYGLDVEDPYRIMDNAFDLSDLPDYYVFSDIVNDEIPNKEFRDNSLVSSYVGAMREVEGVDLKNIRMTELENAYFRYEDGEKVRSDKSFIGEYGLAYQIKV